MESQGDHCPFDDTSSSEPAATASLMRTFLCVIALAAVHIPARSEEPLAKGLSAPIFLPPHPHPVAVLSIGSISKEYARHGYFRIGLLPELIVDSVTLEIRNFSEVGRILSTVKARSKPLLPDHGVRIQNVCLKGDYGIGAVLVAARMQDLGNMRWQFADGVVSTDGTNFHTFDEASLSVGGSDFGQLVAVKILETNLMRFLPKPPFSHPAASKE